MLPIRTPSSALALESPLPEHKESKRRRPRDLLVRAAGDAALRERWGLEEEAGLEACLDPIARRRPMLEPQSGRSLRAVGLLKEARAPFEGDEGVRVDVLARLELRRQYELRPPGAPEVRNVRRSDVDDVDAEVLARFALGLIDCEAERHRRQPARGDVADTGQRLRSASGSAGRERRPRDREERLRLGPEREEAEEIGLRDRRLRVTLERHARLLERTAD